MSLLLQLLYTLLFCLICDLSRTVFADNDNNNNNDKVCSYLAVEYAGNTLIVEKQSYSLYNRSVWSTTIQQDDIYVTYDGATNFWEIILPANSYLPNIYRVESNQIIPPSTQWSNKWTQNQMSITYSCYDYNPSLEPSQISYPHNLSSCAHIINYLNYSIPAGIYYIELLGRRLQVFCHFDLENDLAWTLIESFSQYFASSLYSLSFNLGINAKNPNERDTVYRLPIKQMNELQAVSTHNLVSCNFDCSLSRDYVLIDNQLNGWNILTKTRSICRPVKEINIRGHQCNDGTAPFWTLSNHFHVDSSYKSDECSCNEWTQTAIKNEDDFGQYSYYNAQHTCASANTSTTNFWMGSSINIPSTTTLPITTAHTTNTPITTHTTAASVTCPPCPQCATQDPCPSFINDCSICPTNEPFILSTEMCPPCNITQSIPQTTAMDIMPTTTKCAECEKCATCEPCNNPSTSSSLETSADPCPETIVVYKNISCPTSTPCATTSSTDTVIIRDCEMCVLECKDYFMSTTKHTTISPSVSATNEATDVVITDEPKVTTGHYTRVELLVKYDSIYDLCPSDVFDDYLLELSTCQVLDTESVYCEVQDITSITTIQSVAASDQRRRGLIEYDGFDIAILMQISAEDEQGLDIINRLMNEDDFAYTINEKWQQNADNRNINVGEIMTVITEDVITRAPTITTSNGTFATRADYYLDNIGTATAGVLNLEESIGLLVAVGLLVLCVGLSCAYCVDKHNKSKLKHEDHTEGRSYETEADNDYALPSNNADMAELQSAERQIASLKQQMTDEEDRRLIEEDEKEAQVIIEVKEQTNETDDFDSILNINGYAEFEDSGDMALPTTITTPMHYRSTPQHFVRQNGPIISQMSVQKYHDLVTQKQWLDQLEHQLSEIQASQSQPGAYNLPESILELHSELKRLNYGMKEMLTRLGYSMILNDTDSEDQDTITTCINYARYLQDELINKYGEEIVKTFLGDDDELDMKELEEKRNKLQLQSKRSSRKVSKKYVAMQKGGTKPKHMLTSSQHSDRARGRSRGGQSDETGSMSGVSEAEKELEAMNDNDVMQQYVLAPMKSTSRTYKQQEDDILKSMPDSPSLSSIHVLTPRAQHGDTLILASDATRRRGWSRNKGARSSNEYALEEIEDEVIRYNDPPPKHPKKKYDGFVPKAINRVDTTGKLPTPSASQHQSFSNEDEIKPQKKVSVADLERVVSQHLEEFKQVNTQYLRSKKANKGLPPRPPPPSRTDIEHKDADADADADDDEYYDEDDDDLKEPFVEIQFEERARGNTNGSGSHSDSEAGSLNSADSSEEDSVSELSKSRQIPRKPVVEVGYSSNVGLVTTDTTSESRSKDTLKQIPIIPPAIDTDTDKKEEAEEGKQKKKKNGKKEEKDKAPKKKKKKIKAPKKPKIKSPFFESDAAITAAASKNKGKDTKSKKKKKKKATEAERPRFKYRGKGTGVTPVALKTNEDKKASKKKTGKKAKSKKKDKGKKSSAK